MTYYLPICISPNTIAQLFPTATFSQRNPLAYSTDTPYIINTIIIIFAVLTLTQQNDILERF
jgi:hypothetical protein